MQVDWLEILREQVEKFGTIQAVADQLGYNRSSVSSALSGNYPGGTGKIQAKVIATFCDRVLCPHTKTDVSQEVCTDLRTRALPQSDAGELRQWFACQDCPNNPNQTPLPEIKHA